jgi:hypothetical protein
MSPDTRRLAVAGVHADPALLKEKPEPAGGPGGDSMETFLDTHGQFPDEDISHDEPS